MVECTKAVHSAPDSFLRFLELTVHNDISQLIKSDQFFFSCRCNIYITCCSNGLSQRSAKRMKIAGMIMWKGKTFGLEVSNLTSHVYYLHWDTLNSNQLNTKALR